MTDTAQFQPVADLTALDHVFAQSQSGPRLLFLHDPYCGVSAEAEMEMVEVARREPVALIDVSAQKALSRAVEQRTGVRHESPQVHVLYHGETVWSASHWRITAPAVSQALHASASGTTPGGAASG
jgi:bacillithiol system protein YtxJ